ncbi:MAG: HAMP domain-containing sensor histidine kinase, partial [Eubacteriales bacterium]|nr:HAMP domain-containing sensor histidine kinase [Eubacteriales bacterium]
MIALLRKRFIIIAMCSVLGVLVLIMAALNIANFISVSHDADHVLHFLADNAGAFPKTDAPMRKPDGFRGFTPESPYVTRFFTVTVDEQGEALAVNTGHIRAVTSDDAVSLAKSVWTSGSKAGYLGDYRYLVNTEPEETMVLFLDNSRELSSFRTFLSLSACVSAFCALAIFLLVWFLSRRAIRPIAESYEKQKQFITDAGHEIKTPLTVIEANTEVIEMEHGSSSWTRSIRNQVERLTALTNSLITLSRMEEANNNIQMTAFSFSDAVLETANTFAAQAKTQNKELTLTVEQGVSYTGDEPSIRRLVSILLDNALKYSPTQSSIILSVKKQGKSLLLSCENTVTEPIEPGSHPELFERFYRRDA